MGYKEDKLFDDIVREFMGPSDSSESLFCFLNRSARPYSHKVRELLEEWFVEFPDDISGGEKNRLRTSLRNTRDDRHFASAFFELYCHALIRNQGFKCKSHPRKGSTSYEFSVERDGTVLFYVECISVSGVSDKARGANRSFSRIEDAINKSIKSPNFFLIIKVSEGLGPSPSLKKIYPPVDSWLEGLDPDFDYECQRFSDKQSESETPLLSGVLEAVLPHLHLTVDGWEFLFLAVPKKKEARNKAVRTVGSFMSIPHGQRSIVRWVDSRKPILKRLEGKSSKYGPLDRPYIIALNATDPYVDDDDIDSLFLGAIEIHDIDSSGEVVQTETVLDNFWFQHGHPSNRNVSAVLAVIQLSPFTVVMKTPVLWINPWANIGFDTSLWQGPERVLIPQESKLEPLLIEDIYGKPGWEILRLNSEWPQGGNE